MKMPPGKLVLCIGALLFCTTACDRIKRAQDRERELVNAAGLSPAETAKLLRAGRDVNGRSYSHFGWTPLISAIYHRNTNSIDLLLSHGANPNVTDHDNKTALYWAIESWSQNTNLLVKLMQYGGDPEVKTKLGYNAFDAAKAQPNANELELILRRSKVR